MERGAKIATAAGVLMAGLSVALLFRHDGSRIGATTPDGFDHLVLRGRMEPDSPIAPAVSPSAADAVNNASSGSPSPPSPKVADGTSRKTAAPTGGAAPSLWPSQHYPGQWSAPSQTAATLAAALQKPLRRHRITDGDTLSSLAERYLGAADRAGEIFELNREDLPSPELLPIGREIRIPPREGPRPSTKASPTPRLVPVPAQAMRP